MPEVTSASGPPSSHFSIREHPRCCGDRPSHTGPLAEAHLLSPSALKGQTCCGGSSWKPACQPHCSAHSISIRSELVLSRLLFAVVPMAVISGLRDRSDMAEQVPLRKQGCESNFLSTKQSLPFICFKIWPSSSSSVCFHVANLTRLKFLLKTTLFHPPKNLPKSATLFPQK